MANTERISSQRQESHRMDELIQPVRLSDKVAGRLRGLIGTEFMAGSHLPSERALMARFGVGRPAVREALMSLAQMGLVRVRSGKPALVTMPTADGIIDSLSAAASAFLTNETGIRQLQGARTFFEIGLARYAAQHATDMQITEIERALTANKRALGDIVQFEATDVEFHACISRVIGNPIFTAMHDAMIGWLNEQRWVTLVHKGQARVAYLAHRAIFLGVKSRDPDRAEKAMRNHMAQLVGLYWRMKLVGSEYSADPALEAQVAGHRR